MMFAGQKVQISAAKRMDMDKDCAKMAEAGDCRTNPEYMLKTCPLSCEKQPGIRRAFESEAVDEGDPLFFDLSATTAEGKLMSFDRFEGYVTLVVNAARDCVHMDAFYSQMEHLHSIYPYTIEILVFPFRRAEWDDEGCAIDFKKLDTMKDRKIHIMEESNMNGPNTHPVYKYLKDIFGIDDLDDAVQTFFLINPDGNVVDKYLVKNLDTIQGHIERHLNMELSGEL